MGEAAESDSWLIDQAIAEYMAYCAGELRPSVRIHEAPDGELQYCGRPEDQSRWTVAYVRAEDRVVTPLAVGNFDHVCASFSRLDRVKARIEDPRLFPPPAARVGGVLYRFQAVQGCSLVGAVQVGKTAVLLSAIGDRVAVVYVEGKSRAVLDIKPPLSLREVDVDRMLGFRRPSVSSASASAAELPVQPPAAVQTQHLRIVRGVPVDVGGGPAISEVLRGCFEDIVRRVRVQKQPGKKLKGKTKLRTVLDVMLRLALVGCGDLVGLSGEIIAEIKEHVPEFEITAEAFSDVLNLMRAAKTCLVARGPKARTWRINLVGLGDPRSALHIRLCKETTGCSRVNEAAANHRPVVGGPGPTGPRGRSTGTDARAPAGSPGPDEAAASAPDATGAVGLAGGATAGVAGASVEEEATIGIEAGAAWPGSKDSTTPFTEEGVVGAGTTTSATADTAASLDPQAILGTIAASSPMMLLTAMFAVAQVRVEGDQARMTERAAWEAERQALRAQVDAAAEDRAELLALREQLASMARQHAELLRRVEQAEARVSEGRANHRAAPNAAAQSDQAIAPTSAPAASHVAKPDGGLAVDDVEPYAAHETAIELERANDAHGTEPVHGALHQQAAFEVDPAEQRSEPPSANHAALASPPATEVAGPAELTPEPFHDDVIACADPATFFGIRSLGSLGPRGPPDSGR